MVNLVARAPLEGMTPLVIGGMTLSPVDPGVMTSVAAYNGRGKDLSAALKAAHGVTAPAANRVTGKDGARAIWFGHNVMLLMGPLPDEALADYAALTDQSDAWTVLQLDGPGASEVMARLVPLDLRATEFKRGHTARTEIQHMMGSVTRLGAQKFLLMVFRAHGKTVLHDLKTAMQGVAARGVR